MQRRPAHPGPLVGQPEAVESSQQVRRQPVYRGPHVCSRGAMESPTEEAPQQVPPHSTRPGLHSGQPGATELSSSSHPSAYGSKPMRDPGSARTRYRRVRRMICKPIHWLWSAGAAGIREGSLCHGLWADQAPLACEPRKIGEAFSGEEGQSGRLAAGSAQLGPPDLHPTAAPRQPYWRFEAREDERLHRTRGRSVTGTLPMSVVMHECVSQRRTVKGHQSVVRLSV